MRYLAFLLLCVCSVISASEKEDVIIEIFDSMMADNPKLLELPTLLGQRREEIIESFKPNYNDSFTTANIVLLQEQLYQDAKNSTLFLGFMDGLRNEYIKDLKENFTTRELYELRDIIKNPLIVRLGKMKVDSMKNSFESQWRESNNQLVTEFMERQKKIYELKLKHLKNSNQ